MPTVKTIIGNKVAPWLVERVLAKQGFKGQQSDKPADPNRPDNLYSSPPGDPGAHGRFDAEAHPRSRELWLTEHRGQAVLGAALALAVGCLAWLGARRTA
jgi:hypothetical protein